MIVIEEFFNSTQKSEKFEQLSNPGSALLRIMQYHNEEKELNKIPNKMATWQKFVSKYFSENIQMSVKMCDKEDLFYEISIFVLF